MARLFSKYEEEPKRIEPIRIAPQVEPTEVEPEKKTLRESHHALRISDMGDNGLFYGKTKTADPEEESLRSMVTMFKTLRMLMKMMKGLDVE